MVRTSRLARHTAAAFGLALAAAGMAQAGGTVGKEFPPGFVAFNDHSSPGKPVIGFGGALPSSGKLTRTPVIFLHGNGGVPYRTSCWDTSSYSGDVQGMAQYFANNGYALSELWGLGYLGEGCWEMMQDPDRPNDVTAQSLVPPYNASLSHTIAENVPDLRSFVLAVLEYTKASQVDIVAHGMGVVLAREWVRQDRAGKLVRKLVGIEGPNQGMIICSKHQDGNPWSLYLTGWFTPNSPVCQELGSPNTVFLQVLNSANDGERVHPKDTLAIRNGDRSFLFRPEPDGLLMPTMPTPVADSYGYPADFTDSATLQVRQGATGEDLEMWGQGGSDSNALRKSAHVGIANSPDTWAAALEFLQRSSGKGK